MGNEQIDDTMPLLKRRLLNVNKKVQLDATICRHLFTAVQSRPRWNEVAVPVLLPIPEVAVTVFSAPDDGCCDARNM